MKRIVISTALLFLSMSLAGTAFARDKSANIELYQASQVGGATLQPGSYKVVVNTTGTTADVSFRQNGKQVATVTGQTVQLAQKSANTSVTIDSSSSVPRINAIDFEGSPTEVSFSSSAAASSSGD